jgi:hypothetical protein
LSVSKELRKRSRVRVVLNPGKRFALKYTAKSDNDFDIPFFTGTLDVGEPLFSLDRDLCSVKVVVSATSAISFKDDEEPDIKKLLSTIIIVGKTFCFLFFSRWNGFALIVKTQTSSNLYQNFKF